MKRQRLNSSSSANAVLSDLPEEARILGYRRPFLRRLLSIRGCWILLTGVFTFGITPLLTWWFHRQVPLVIWTHNGHLFARGWDPKEGVAIERIRLEVTEVNVEGVLTVNRLIRVLYTHEDPKKRFKEKHRRLFFPADQAAYGRRGFEALVASLHDLTSRRRRIVRPNAS